MLRLGVFFLFLLVTLPAAEAAFNPDEVENFDHQFVDWTGTACYKRTNNQATKGKTCLIEHMDEAKQVGAIFRIAPKRLG